MIVTYEVTATVEEALVDDYERFMRETHIPDVLATGLFQAAALEKTAEGRYRIRYQAARQEDLDRYLAEHTARLRGDFVGHFPTGVALTREVWTEIQQWATR